MKLAMLTRMAQKPLPGGSGRSARPGLGSLDGGGQSGEIVDQPGARGDVSSIEALLDAGVRIYRASTRCAKSRTSTAACRG